jgi:putative endonuclease
MAKHLLIGKKGEEMAVKYLQAKGYTIVCLNWQFQKAEIDIIAQTETGMYVFVEVKTRSSQRLGYPEQAVTRQKQRLLSLAASEYVAINQIQGNVRFDIIAITLHAHEPEIYHIEDAFFGY